MNKPWRPLSNGYKKPMVTITFVKKDILKAISKSCITHGSFFQNIFNKDPKAFKFIPGIGLCIEHKNLYSLAKNCDMDAIGAILTHCVLNKKARGIDGNAIGYALKIFGSVYHNYDTFLSKKEYLSALDTYFETIDRDGRLLKSKVKFLVLKFIKDNFPARFTMKVSAEYKPFLKD